MTPTALGLVFVAACTHATWNLSAKQAVRARHFVWLYSVLAVLIWFPAAAYLVVTTRPDLGPRVWLAFFVTGALHMAYSLGLQRAYAVGDLSVVYPIVRGTGPLLSFFGAMVVLGERPTWIAGVGTALVVTGVFLSAGGAGFSAATAPALRWGLGTGALTAAYTLWDGYSVKHLAILPLLIDYSGNAFRVVALAPSAWSERTAILPELRTYTRAILAVAVLGPLGYILVLTAMQLAPVSQVAPARELSMLIGAMLGARVLGEGRALRRVFAAGLIAAGVMALALG